MIELVQYEKEFITAILEYLCFMIHFLRISLSVLCISFVGYSQVPQTEWVFQLGNRFADGNPKIAVSPGGNFYLAGEFKGVFDADPSAISWNLTSSGNKDIFLAKYRPDGTLIWATSFGGVGKDRLNDMVVSAGGQIYLTGSFKQQINFGQPNNLNSAGRNDIFIIKISENAQLVWAKRIGAGGRDAASSISLDEGFAYLTGFFSGTVDFDPGTGVEQLTSDGDNDRFILKIDINGNYVWAKEFGMIEGYSDRIFAKDFHIANDQHGAVYVTGTWAPSALSIPARIDLYPGQGYQFVFTTSPSTDGYILKLDSAGNYQRAGILMGSGHIEFNGINLTPQKEIQSYGRFSGFFDFDFDTSLHILSGPPTPFGVPLGNYVTTYNQEGELEQVREIGGNEMLEINSVVAMPDGSKYMTGNFRDTCDFQPGNGYEARVSKGFEDGFLCKLGPNGDLKWVHTMGADSSDSCSSVVTGRNGELYVVGTFEDTLNLSPNHALISWDSSNIFVQKMVEIPTQLLPGSNHQIRVYPNPSNGALTLTSKANLQNVIIRVFDTRGVEISKMEINEFQSIGIQLPQEPGVYLVRIQTGQQAPITHRIIKK